MILRSMLALVFLMSLAPMTSAQPDASQSAMLHAARTFLATLTPAEKSQASFPFNSEERFHWFYTPVPRKGISLKEMTAPQKQAAMNLLRTGLSEKGYTKAATIRQLEDVMP